MVCITWWLMVVSISILVNLDSKTPHFWESLAKVADLSPIHFRKESRHRWYHPPDLNIVFLGFWRLDSGSNLQPCMLTLHRLTRRLELGAPCFGKVSIHGFQWLQRKEDGLPGRTDTWLITMVIVKPRRMGLWDPFQMAELHGLWMGVVLTTY